MVATAISSILAIPVFGRVIYRFQVEEFMTKYYFMTYLNKCHFQIFRIKFITGSNNRVTEIPISPGYVLDNMRKPVKILMHITYLS